MSIKFQKKEEMFNLITNLHTNLQTVQENLEILLEKDGNSNQEILNSLENILNRKVDSEEFLIVTVVASDNLVNRSFKTWDVNILKQMSKNSKGIQALVNHDWDDIKCSVGVVIDTWLETLDEIPKDYKQIESFKKFNNQVVEREGFNRLKMTIAIPKTESEVVAKIQNGVINNVSTGGWMLKADLICPLCSETHGRKVSFMEVDKNKDYVCPHLIPSSWGNSFNVDDEYKDYYAPYAILDGIYDDCEISFVNIPNLPGTGIVRD